MLFTNRTYTKHQDIHDQESFRKSGLLYSAFQSPIQYCVVTASVTEIFGLLNLWVNNSHFAACINLFLPLDYS